MDEAELHRLRRRLSPLLLRLPGVAGVGTAGGDLVVYLEAADAEPRAREALAAEVPGLKARFTVSGRFRKG